MSICSSVCTNDLQADVRRILSTVTDPEIPVISIEELGILQGIKQQNDTVIIDIIPTYSGCPAMQEIKHDIIATLHQAGYANVQVQIKLTPVWSTELIQEQGKQKMKQYGIAPPSKKSVHCPLCDSNNTELISEFGSTACKALYRCTSCLEPFDYFKCH